MTERAKEILRIAMELTEQERAELAGTLLESLEPPADVDVDAAWRIEIARRVEEIKSGKAKGTPWPEVRDRLLAKLRAPSD